MNAAPGQSAASCRALADNLRDTAARVEAQRIPKAPYPGLGAPKSTPKVDLAAGFRKSAEEWERLARALEREPTTVDA